MNTYFVKKTGSKPKETDWNTAEAANVDSCIWEDCKSPYHTTVKLLYNDDAIYVRFTTNEDHLRAVNNTRNSEVCEDSCVEFFLAPCKEDIHYINFEINPLGTILTYKCNNRISMEPDDCDAAIFDIESIIRNNFWQLTYTIPFDFLKKHFPYISKEMRGNFYKCGNLTDMLHYGIWNTITNDKKDFHQSEYFGKIVLS